MSFSENIGLQVKISASILSDSTFAEIDLLKLDKYTHVINAIGGYWNCKFAFGADQTQAEMWYTDGIGKHVEVFDSGMLKIWEGFINEININIGTLKAKRGPLLNVSNRVDLVYSTIDTSTDPPVVGVRENTGVANDTDSQNKYGIIYKVLSTGGTTITDAEQIRDTFLQENKYPETDQSISIGSASAGSVELSCLGYSQWLDTFTYSETTTGTRTYTLRIEDVLGADPNNIFSTDYSKISTNGATVPRYDNDDRKGWQIIKEILAKGDTSYNRWTFGIYNNRVAVYAVAPSSIEYYHRINDTKQRILDSGETEVKPWNVLPARWLQITDWLVGQSIIGDFRKDERNLFIESVNYTMPYGLSISGSKINTLAQILGRLGLTGIGA